VRETLGDDVTLMADANHADDLRAARRVADDGFDVSSSGRS